MSGRLSATLAGILLLAVAWFALGNRRTLPTLTFLAVGQGDAIVWQDGGVNVMVDVGPKTREGFDAGERIVLPKLRRMGIGKVDVIFITHPDSDHIGGLPALAKRFPSSKVFLNSGFKDNPDMSWWIKEAGLGPDRVVWLSGRHLLRYGETVIDVAAPPIGPGGNDNDGSLFIRIGKGSASAVMTGDASIAMEESMQKELGWRAQVLKAGHHGSRTSTSAAFVRSTNPNWAVVSCGRDNRFDHPHKSVLAVLQRESVEVFRTDLQGDVAFEVRERGFVPLLRSVDRSK